MDLKPPHLVIALRNASNLLPHRDTTVFMEKQNPWPCLDDLTRATDGGHNLATYLVALSLYRHNGDANDDDTMRLYMRWD